MLQKCFLGRGGGGGKVGVFKTTNSKNTLKNLDILNLNERLLFFHVFSAFVYLVFFPDSSLSVCLSLCLSVCLSVCLSICLSLCLSVCLSVCLAKEGSPKSVHQSSKKTNYLKQKQNYLNLINKVSIKIKFYEGFNSTKKVGAT